MNLITNAADAIDEQSGVISLSTGSMDCSRSYLDGLNLTLLASLQKPLREGVYSYIEVTDTGCGIPKNIQKKILKIAIRKLPELYSLIPQIHKPKKPAFYKLLELSE